MYETWGLVTGTAILTDATFTAYGGQTGTSTAAQRNAAYCIAEQFAIQEIGTFLVPTTVTGTFQWPLNGLRLHLPHSHVTAVPSVTGIHDAGCDCADDAIEISGCAWIMDGDNGVIDLRECSNTIKASCSGCSCGEHGTMPFQVRVVYTAGLPAGKLAAAPSSLMGLVTAADLALEQIIDPAAAEGGPGDPQLVSFSDTGYGETREGLRMTAFGGSPRANYAARMLSVVKHQGALKL